MGDKGPMVGEVVVDDALIGPEFLPGDSDNCPTCGAAIYWETHGITVRALTIWIWPDDSAAPTCRVCGHVWDLLDRDRKRREVKDHGGWWNE